jgi:hypothetical protein
MNNSIIVAIIDILAPMDEIKFQKEKESGKSE